MAVRVFNVRGNEPYDHDVNHLLRAFDLGIIGAYVPFYHTLTCTLKDNVTADQLARQSEGIKQAYEACDCIGVEVWEKL